MCISLFIYFIAALSVLNAQDCVYNYAFVIDESGSIGQADYQKSIDFVIDLVQNHIDITARLMALAFSDNGALDDIHMFTDAQNPRQAIVAALNAEKSDYDSGETYTEQALETVLNEFVNQGYTTNNIIILVTDGEPTDGPCDNNDLRDDLVAQGIRVIIVGVGVFDESKVECLVNGNNNDIIPVVDFDFDPAITQLQKGLVIWLEKPECGECIIWKHIGDSQYISCDNCGEGLFCLATQEDIAGANEFIYNSGICIPEGDGISIVMQDKCENDGDCPGCMRCCDGQCLRESTGEECSFDGRGPCCDCKKCVNNQCINKSSSDDSDSDDDDEDDR